ncbi:T-cell-specific surface glycoprotein CD28 [Trichomycterus rosablanca]|uniref:T-cell-specific surface glycoprotein CD28 n=1 Tax=Trichomycterus rosablanca TaxID=2290929 RepID=UPI002F35EFFE
MIVILITVIMGIPLGHAFHVFQPYYAVGRQGQVSLHCTYKTKPLPLEMQVSVYKGMYGKERICRAFVNVSNPHIVTDGAVHCIGNVSTERVDLTIFGLKGEDTDLYRCQLEVFFPPPYRSEFGNGTLVYIPESPDCPTENVQARIQQVSETYPNKTDVFPLILLYAIFMITMASLIIQIMKIILRKRKSNHTLQTLSQKGDYKNFT